MSKPLHVIEGAATDWERWFAWRPVRTEQNAFCWLRSTWRRRFFPPLWFVPPAPVSWWQYSDTQRTFWDDYESARAALAEPKSTKED